MSLLSFIFLSAVSYIDEQEQSETANLHRGWMHKMLETDPDLRWPHFKLQDLCVKEKKKYICRLIQQHSFRWATCIFSDHGVHTAEVSVSKKIDTLSIYFCLIILNIAISNLIGCASLIHSDWYFFILTAL